MANRIGKVRIKFLPGKQKEFIEKALLNSGLLLDELSQLAGVVPRSFRDWRREKLSMPLEAAELFCEQFQLNLPEDKEIMLNRWREEISKSSRKGGLACYNKHGSPATVEGRRKGGAKTLKILREKGVIPPPKHYDLPHNFSSNLAEFVGIVLGDGGITPSQLQISFNAIKDFEYSLFVQNLGKSLYGQEPKSLRRKRENVINLYFNGVLLVKYLMSLGLKTGNKVRQQVDVPDWIKENKQYRVSCLRGLIDTDGGVFNHRYKVNGKEYVYQKICFSNRSVPLLNFVASVLKELTLTPKLVTKVENKKVWLYNSQEIEKYFLLVGSSNPRLLIHRA